MPIPVPSTARQRTSSLSYYYRPEARKGTARRVWGHPLFALRAHTIVTSTSYPLHSEPAMTTADLLRDLVRLPSVNPMGRAVSGPTFLEGRVTDYLDAYFSNLGVPFDRQLVAPQRENIVARFNSGATCTVVFEVHQDT